MAKLYQNPSLGSIVDDILTIDARKLRIKRTEFVKLNHFQVEVAVESQAALIYDLLPHTEATFVEEFLYHEYTANGFVYVQRCLLETSAMFLRDLEDANGTLELRKYYAKRGFEELIFVILSCADIKVLLQVLNYLARFTLITDVISEQSKSKFLGVNTKCHDLEFALGKTVYVDRDIVINNYGRAGSAYFAIRYSLPSQYLLEVVASEMKAVFGVKPIKLTRDGAFSSGSTAEGASTLPSKVQVLASYLDNWDGNPSHVTGSIRTGRGYPFDVGYPRLIAVPKSLESKRVIAPEPVALAYYSQGALKALRIRLQQTGAMDYINRHEDRTQVGAEENKERACIGSADGTIATIDMSSASDSISKHIFFAVCPLALRPFYASYISWYVTTDDAGRRVRLSTLFTSGNPLTWDTEAGYFLSIARAGCKLAGVKDYRSKCWSYGDDIEVPAEAYETVCDLLAIFGHKVNKAKSYSYGMFRESCGGWYYKGEDVTPKFWPRSEVTTNSTSIASMCQLQHRMYPYENCRAVIEKHVKVAIPGMTYSPIGEACDDLWGEVNPYLSERASHLGLRPRKPCKSNVIFEHWLYFKYLKDGPEYNDALDELLHVSCSRRVSLLSPEETEWSEVAPLFGVHLTINWSYAKRALEELLLNVRWSKFWKR